MTTQWTDRQPGMFDVCKCVERQLQNSFDQVVIVSNDGTYGKDIDVRVRLRGMRGAAGTARRAPG